MLSLWLTGIRDMAETVYQFAFARPSPYGERRSRDIKQDALDTLFNGLSDPDRTGLLIKSLKPGKTLSVQEIIPNRARLYYPGAIRKEDVAANKAFLAFKEALARRSVDVELGMVIGGFITCAEGRSSNDSITLKYTRRNHLRLVHSA